MDAAPDVLGTTAATTQLYRLLPQVVEQGSMSKSLTPVSYLSMHCVNLPHRQQMAGSLQWTLRCVQLDVPASQVHSRWLSQTAGLERENHIVAICLQDMFSLSDCLNRAALRVEQPFI